MKRKQFKTESQKLLDMMINSIYTHKEIFLRELISNASDAIDKLYFRSLTDDNIIIGREDYAIHIERDTDARTLTISDTDGYCCAELEDQAYRYHQADGKRSVSVYQALPGHIRQPLLHHWSGGHERGRS